MTGKEEGFRHIVLSNGIEARVYAFSDYISCVDLYHGGKMIRSFCSDHQVVEEWLEEPEILLSFLK